MTNCTDVLVENLRLSHFPGMMFIHNSQNVMVRNMTMINRNNPEETGDIEFGGIGSHGEPWNSPWQYEVKLMRANNITMRDSYVTGGDDNVCIKNDTANVLIENVTFLDGHGASIGSIPDCSGCHGVVTNITCALVGAVCIQPGRLLAIHASVLARKARVWMELTSPSVAVTRVADLSMFMRSFRSRP